MRILQSTVEPFPNSPGVEGHGEGVDYNGKTFYYRAGCLIPKDKVVSLFWEGDYAGRVHGEKEYIIVGYKGDDIVLIDTLSFGSIRERMRYFKGLTPEEAIELVQKEEDERKVSMAQIPDCKGDGCNNKVLRFEEEQPEDLCLTCWGKTK